MNFTPEIKAKWVATLRSGDYKQASGSLHWPAFDTYCCLGVLCKIQEMGTVDSKDNYRPLEAALGLDTMMTLVDMNDVDKKSFAEIADYIEENL